jgi:hypothetical protein
MNGPFTLGAGSEIFREKKKMFVIMSALDHVLRRIHQNICPSHQLSPIEKRASWMDSPRQRGHLPGFRSRARFEKMNPHFLHSAGVMIRCLVALLAVFLMCSRWSYTSRSEILTSLEISPAERSPCPSAVKISCRIV